MTPWQILALVGVLLSAAEIFTPSFVMLPAGVAFLLTALVGAVVPPWSANRTALLAVLALWLLVVYATFYWLVWPKMSKAPSAPKTGADGLVGKRATVSEAVVPGTSEGYVKLYGDTWRAVGTRRYEVGTEVLISGIDGNKVLIEPID